MTRPEWLDDEFPDAEYGDEESDTVPCPECGAEVYEDAEQCPSCGNWVVHRTWIWSGRPAWWIALGVLGVLALCLALILQV